MANSNWWSFGDRMVYCRLSMLRKWWNCSNPASFHNPSSGCSDGGLVLGGGRLKKAATYLAIRRCSSSSAPVIPGSLSSSPLLMVPPGAVVVDDNNSDEEKKSEIHFNFFSLSERSDIRVLQNLRMPCQKDFLSPNAAPCVCSSHGWLTFTHPRNGHTYLYNPLIDSPHLPCIPLPTIGNLPYSHDFCPSLDHLYPFAVPNSLMELHKNDRYEEYLSSRSDTSFYLRKLVMSSAPSFPCDSSSSSSKLEFDSCCTIMALHSRCGQIASCKPGDRAWNILDCSTQQPNYIDIIYFSKYERFYAMRSDCRIEAWDLRDCFRPKKQVFGVIAFGPGKLGRKFRKSYDCVVEGQYLVESSGELLLISRFTGRVQPEPENDEAYWTLGFDVHKLDFNHSRWKPMESLGDRALFVGSNHSFSLSTLDYPDLVGNSIYYTDDNFMKFSNTYHGHDNGIFHLEDSTTKVCYPNRLKIVNAPPIWVAPNTM